MTVDIEFKKETRLDFERIFNVSDIWNDEDFIEIEYNNSITQLEKEIKITKRIPKKLIDYYKVSDF